MSPLNQSESIFPISYREGCWGAPLEISNRFTAYSIDPIELKLAMIILDINLHNHYEQKF